MSLKITFLNPNNQQEVDKHLPKVLAEALVRMINKENGKSSEKNEFKARCSA